ncbi:NAD(P)-dependent oxidoreductase [Aliiglaciecola sp.]|nr:NAD(P)-dependent oxidoreductase [Aliiglaciecola sp.]
MNVLVSGANGFVGKHVCNALLAQNHSVIGLTQTVESLSHDIDARIKWLTYPIGKEKRSFNVESLHLDAVVHLAWPELDNYQSESHQNIYPIQHFDWLHNLIKQGVKKLQVVGTCFEYGLIEGCLDEHTVVMPHTCYGKGKNRLRQKLEELQKHQRFCLQWPRLFYTYGEGQRINSFVPMLKTAIASGQNEFKMSAGDQVRDYLPVEIISQLLVRLLETEESGIFNCSSNEPTTIRQLAQDIIEQAHASIHLLLGHYPYSPNEPKAFWGNNKKLLNALQLQSIHDLQSIGR